MRASCLRVLRARTVDPDPEVRYRARRELAELCRDHHACPFQRDLPSYTVRGALRSSSALRRWRAARTARSCGEAGLLDVVVEQLQCDVDPWVRAELVRAVGALAPMVPAGKLAGVLRVLDRSLKDPDERVRANAVEVLSELGHPPPIAELWPLVDGIQHRARAAAVVAAGRAIGPRLEVLSNLWEMLVSARPSMRASGAYAISALRPFWGPLVDEPEDPTRGRGAGR